MNSLTMTPVKSVSSSDWVVMDEWEYAPVKAVSCSDWKILDTWSSCPSDDDFLPLNEASHSSNITNDPSLPDEVHFEKPHMSTAEIGVQTTSTAIFRVPVPSHTHPVPWGVDKEKASPLALDNHIANHGAK